MNNDTLDVDDGIDRRGFLKCMAWAGTGLLFTVGGGVPRSFNLGTILREGKLSADSARAVAAASFTFIQISDSHIGFSKEANKDVVGTLREAVSRINLASPNLDLLIHTGDLSHLSKDDQFDTLDQVLKDVKTDAKFFVPGEHDVLVDDGAAFRQRYGKQAKGDGWYSFDHKGVHFIALVNVLNLKPGGLGVLGIPQLEWLADDVRSLSAETPIVVFAHVPLWAVYPDWGWGTDDGAQALALLKRFGSVTVLNGHIHQSIQKVEGNVTFHTAMSTAFPQPKPGTAKSPGPMTVPAEDLRASLGLTSVKYVENRGSLAIVDSTLALGPDPAAQYQVTIDNFTFNPPTLAVPVRSTVVWTNHDDIPHTVVENAMRFKSPVLDTGDKFEHVFSEAGTFPYFCSIHPHMTGKIAVS